MRGLNYLMVLAFWARPFQAQVEETLPLADPWEQQFLDWEARDAVPQEDALEAIQTDLWAETELNDSMPHNLQHWAQWPGMNVYRAAFLEAHIKRYGFPQSQLEWARIPGFDSLTIYQLRQALEHKQRPKANPQQQPLAFKQGRLQWLMRYSRRAELPNAKSLNPHTHPGSALLGSADRWLLRFQLKKNHQYQLGFTAEKDPFEPWGGLLADSFTGHYAQFGKGLCKQWILGDFNMQIGQGLQHWTSPTTQATSTASGFMRFSQGVRPYQGAIENRSLRGLAFVLEHKNWKSQWWYSHRNLSARIHNKEVASVNWEGLHTTPNALSTKNQLPLKQLGTYHSLNFQSLKMGISFNQIQSAFVFASPQKNQGFVNTAQAPYYMGFDFLKVYKGLFLYGEISTLQFNSWSATLGTQFKTASGLEIGLRGWHQPPAYFHALSPLLNLAVRGGEQSLNIGIDWPQSRFWRFEFQAQYAQSLGPGYYRPLQSVNTFWLIRSLYSINGRRLELMFRSGMRTDGQAPTFIENELDSIGIPERAHTQHSNRLRLDYKLDLHTALGIRWRIEQQWYNAQELETSTLVCQDLKWQLRPQTWQLQFRLMAFFIPTYNSRLYAYEADLPGAMSIPAYTQSGGRGSLLLQWKPKPAWQFGLKIGRSRFWNATSLGSPPMQTEGPYRTDFKCQLVWKP